MDTQTLALDPAVAGFYCGPAIVIDAGPTLRLQLPSGDVQAQLALAYPYRPQPNDLVLAVGAADGDIYVIGVLQGSGQTRLCVDGDLDIEASGRLRLRGAAGVAIESREVALVAERYTLSAKSVIERLGNVYRWTRGLIMTSAARTRTTVEHSATLAAGRIVQKAKQDVVIDGEQIRLG